MSFKKIGKGIKNAFQSIPAVNTSTSNTLAGKLKGEKKAEIKGEKDSKIPLNIVDKNTPVKVSPFKQLLNKISRKQNVIKMLDERNELNTKKILELQKEMCFQTNQWHSELVILKRDKVQLIKEMNEKQEIIITQKTQYQNQINELNRKINLTPSFPSEPDLTRAENNLLKNKIKRLTEKLSIKGLTEIPVNWEHLKDEYETTIMAQTKTIGMMAAKLNGTDYVCINNGLTAKHSRDFKLKRDRSITIRDLELIITERNNNIKELHIQNTLLSVQIVSELKAKDKEIDDLHLQLKEQQVKLDELANTSLHEYEIEY